MAGCLCRRLAAKTFIPKINKLSVRTFTKDNGSQRIVSSDDGNTVVCWHPEVDFPYEKSLPIKLVNRETNSVLNVQNLKEVTDVFREKQPEFIEEELTRLTYTTKHRWVPEGRHKRRRKRNFEENRPYL